MLNILETFNNSFSNVQRMVVFNYFKTGDPVIDTIFTTFVLGVLTWLFNFVYDNLIDVNLSNISFDDIVGFFHKKNTIIIEGKRCSSASDYGSQYAVSSAYSDRFKAVLNYIVKNMEKNTSIYKIREQHSNYQSSERESKISDIYMVSQRKHFKIDDNIFGKIEFEQENAESFSGNESNKKRQTKIDKITIYIYSYIYSLSHIKIFVDNITEKYLLSIKDKRENKRFIYYLEKTDFDPDIGLESCWKEDPFESARTFNNIFFDGKNELVKKIDFFMNNRSWYYEKGIPYSLGIGLHGPPGTGKTSFIKALANHTNRHVVVISLKLIKTKQQLEKFFFENTYNDDNENNTIDWNKKIIVFEDIDCVGDIVLNRSNKFNKNKKVSALLEKSIEINNEEIKISDIVQAIKNSNDLSTKTTVEPLLSSLNTFNPVTLDDILNLWDGIRETPGRILVISSNHYCELDPALVRPGRIDITHEFSNASRNVIAEIYQHLFNKPIDKSVLQRVKDKFYSPAELINIYVSNKDEKSFVNRLIKNTKIN